jgi:hypothetical protein
MALYLICISYRIAGITLVGVLGGILLAWVPSLIPSVIGLCLIGFYGGFCEATFVSMSSFFLKYENKKFMNENLKFK